MPKVKSFLHNEASLFENVSVKWIGGADPVAVFYDVENKEIERVPISQYSEQDIRNLLATKVFDRKIFYLHFRDSNTENLRLLKEKEQSYK
jgi:hypothetical protein